MRNTRTCARTSAAIASWRRLRLSLLRIRPESSPFDSFCSCFCFGCCCSCAACAAASRAPCASSSSVTIWKPPATHDRSSSSSSRCISTDTRPSGNRFRLGSGLCSRDTSSMSPPAPAPAARCVVWPLAAAMPTTWRERDVDRLRVRCTGGNVGGSVSAAAPTRMPGVAIANQPTKTSPEDLPTGQTW